MELLLGQIPEAIFFALFMIYAKGIKEKRILFIILMIIEYLLLKYSFPFNWIFQIGYMVTTFLTLKVLYMEKSQITDVFILLISYIFMIASSAICFVISCNNVLIATILNRIIIFTLLFLFKNKLYKIQNLYKSIWNKNNNKNKAMKTTTFRSLNIVIFNIVYFVINFGMIYAIYYNNLIGGV